MSVAVYDANMLPKPSKSKRTGSNSADINMLEPRFGADVVSVRKREVSPEFQINGSG